MMSLLLHAPGALVEINGKKIRNVVDPGTDERANVIEFHACKSDAHIPGWG